MPIRRTVLKQASALATGAVLVGVPAWVRAQPVALKIQGFLPATTSPQQALAKMADELKAASGGRLQLQVLPGGAAVAVGEALDAMRSGILDGNYTAASYFAGKDPAFTLLGDTGSSFNDVGTRDRWFTEGGGVDIAREIYARHGAHYVGPVFWASEQIPARRALNGVDDLKGLKIRVPPGLIADILGRAGASVVNVPGGEVFNSLQSGVIDATDWASPALNMQAGLYRAAKFSVNASHSMPTTDVTISQRKWDALPQDLRTLLEQHVAKMSGELRATLKSEDEKAQASMKEQGVTVITWPAPEVAKLRRFTAAVQQDVGGRTELARKVVDSLSAFQKKAGVA